MTLSVHEAVRDWVIIVWGSIGILAFLFFILFLLALWRGINSLIGETKVVVREDVRPIIATSRESVNNVAGTTRFLGDTIVRPVIRVYGIVAGIRRFIGVFTGLAGRGRKSRA
jgi:hypothetical protein